MIVRGSLLRKLRIESGLTQSQLAKLVGVSQAHIAKIEGEKVDPRLSTVNKILQVLIGGGGRKCKEIMTEGVISARPNDKVRKVSELMMKHAISQLPVMDGDRVVGTITEEDIIKNLSSTISDEKVEKVMSPPLPSVPEDANISMIRPLLEAYPGVLVTRNGKVVGIITRSDLLKVVSKLL